MARFAKWVSLLAALVIFSQSAWVYASACQTVMQECHCQHRCADANNNNSCCEVRVPTALPSANLPAKLAVDASVAVIALMPAVSNPLMSPEKAAAPASLLDFGHAPPLYLQLQQIRL